MEEKENPLYKKTFDVRLFSRDGDGRGVTSSDFKVSIPLEPTSGKTFVRKLFVRPLLSKGTDLLKTLVWHAIYGRKSFKSIHWFILFNMINRETINAKIRFGLYAILKLSFTGRPGTYGFNKTHRSVKSALGKSSLSNLEQENVLKKIVRQFPFSIPRKVPGLDRVLQIKEKSVEQKKPSEPRRIGVGYKDKGSLGKPDDGYHPIHISDDWETNDDSLSLQRNFRSFFPEYEKIRKENYKT